MADPQTNLRVRISGDLQQFNASMKSLRSNVLNVKTAIAGAFAGIGGAALVGSVIKATAEAEKVMAQLEARLKSTQGVAGLTKDELVDMASGLQQVTTYGDEAIISAESMLLTFTKLGKDVFPAALEATLNLATAMDTDLNSAAIQVGKALNDPVKGVAALSKAGIQFTKDQRDMIEALVKTGRTADAQRIILGELETQFGGAARAARETLGGAFQALQEAAGDLLEGDSDSLDGVRTSIEDLIELLQSQRVKDGFATMVQGLATIANTAAKSLTEVANFTRFVAEEVAARVNGPSLDDVERVADRRRRLRDTDAQLAKIQRQGGVPDLSKISELKPGDLLRPLAEVRARLQDEIAKATTQLEQAQRLADDAADRAASATTGSGNGKPTPPVAPVVDPEDAEKAAAKAEKLRLKLKELQAQHEENLRKLREEEVAREEKLQQELDEVETSLLRAAGRESDAAFRDIDAKYADLLKRLRANSNVAGERIVNELIDVQKAQARMAEFGAQFDQVLAGFDQVQGLATAKSAAGIIGPAAAEEQINAARDESLIKLQQLRDAAAAYYETLSGPAATAALESIGQMDVQIAQLQETQNGWVQDTADIAQSSLGSFFGDLADSTKTFKESFLDMVRSFVKGIGQMIAQELALKAVRTGLSLLPGGTGASAGVAHSGGIAGSLGRMRQNVNPGLFGTAPRYHSGGIAGLAADEVPAILQKGEEVLTRSDPRHRANGGAGGRSVVTTPIVAIGDDAVADAMAGTAGENVVITHVRNNWDRLTRGSND